MPSHGDNIGHSFRVVGTQGRTAVLKVGTWERGRSIFVVPAVSTGQVSMTLEGQHCDQWLEKTYGEMTIYSYRNLTHIRPLLVPVLWIIHISPPPSHNKLYYTQIYIEHSFSRTGETPCDNTPRYGSMGQIITYKYSFDNMKFYFTVPETGYWSSSQDFSHYSSLLQGWWHRLGLQDIITPEEGQWWLKAWEIELQYLSYGKTSMLFNMTETKKKNPSTYTDSIISTPDRRSSNE